MMEASSGDLSLSAAALDLPALPNPFRVLAPPAVTHYNGA